MFPIMFKTGHALLLPGGRFPCPRSGGVESAEWSRERAGSWPQTRHGSGRELTQTRAQSRVGNFREQSVIAFHSRPQSWQETVRSRDSKTMLPVRDQALALGAQCPQLVRVRVMATVKRQHFLAALQAPRLAARWPYCRITAFTLPPTNFPVRIQTISGL